MNKKKKTYAETRGCDPFNWNEFLNKKKITKEEWGKALELANKWVTCACGSQCSIIPRSKMGMPKDYVLLGLGLCFSRLIGSRQKAPAKKVLEKIEKRSAEIIKNLI